MNPRQEKIVQYLSEEGYGKIEVFAEKFEVSNETIRRDLLALEQEAYINRVRGGARYDNLRAKEKKYEVRTQRNFREKRAIAKLAAEYISDGDTIAINTGTSTLELAKEIVNRNYLTVITNSVDVASLIVENDLNKVYLPGGLLRNSGRGISGEMCCEFISHFQVDKAILSIGGISSKCGITEYHVEESAVLRKMIEISNKVMVLGDYSKFNEIALNKICDYRQVDYLFTDWKTPAKEILECKKAGVNVGVAERNADVEKRRKN